MSPGPRMLAALEYVMLHPGCSKSDAARCGKEGPLYSGSVNTLVRRGYVEAGHRSGGRYALTVTAYGRGALDAWHRDAGERDLDKLVSGYDLSQVTAAALELAEHLAYVANAADAMDVVNALRRRREALRDG